MDSDARQHTHDHEHGFKEVCKTCLGQVDETAPKVKKARSIRGVTFTTVLLITAFGFTIWKQSHHSQSSWQTYYDAGHRALKTQDFANARKNFALAVQESEHFKLTDHRRLSSMHRLADVEFYNLHNAKEALPHFEKIATVYQNILQHDDPELAEAYNDLAQVYAVEERYPESEKYFQKAMKVAERTKPIEEHAKLSDIVKNYAEMLEKTNRHKEAMRLIEQAEKARL